MATNNTQNEENPRKTLTEQPPSDPHPTEAPNNSTPPVLQQSPPPTATEASPEDSGDESKATTGDPTTVDSNNSGSVTDSLRKIQRAERFGMPVHLSEEEKRNSRAERFGTGSGLHGSDAIKKSEELKRKARAERFGLGLVQSVSVDEDAKKKARLARFAPVLNTDSREEDKKQARSLRFSQSSSSVSQPNGKGNIEPKPAIAGKAGGVA